MCEFVANRKLLREIHETVVKGTPASADLVRAAEAVVTARYKGSSWEELKEAIGELADTLERAKL